MLIDKSMNKKALIIFVRNPVLGKVKTRLAATVGDEKALEIYQSLLQHTHDITAGLNCDKYVYYADEVANNDMWGNAHFKKAKQAEGNLGYKMMRAFADMFQKGYQSVCIIGSDCLSLTATAIKEAFDKLEQADVVIGPSEDGGYYLLGMKKVIAPIFTNKQWSTDSVFPETMTAIKLLSLTHSLLPVLSDIDTEEDWEKQRQQVSA